jgi:hypothetical protein
MLAGATARRARSATDRGREHGRPGATMTPHFADDGLRQRLRLLERQIDYLQEQNDMLDEAIGMICAAFLNNSTGLDTAIQAAMTLQQRARQSSDQVRRGHRNWDLEIG